MSKSASTDRMEQMRALVMVAKSASQSAQMFNAWNVDEGQPPPFSADDLRAFRLLVHLSARAARMVGAEISDLVGPDVGAGDSIRLADV